MSKYLFRSTLDFKEKTCLKLVKMEKSLDMTSPMKKSGLPNNYHFHKINKKFMAALKCNQVPTPDVDPFSYTANPTLIL